VSIQPPIRGVQGFFPEGVKRQLCVAADLHTVSGPQMNVAVGIHLLFDMPSWLEL
jgi:hypothetical protein